MKKSTFNDNALFKKKNTAQIIMGKRTEAKKNIFEEEEEDEDILAKPIKKPTPKEEPVKPKE